MRKTKTFQAYSSYNHCDGMVKFAFNVSDVPFRSHDTLFISACSPPEKTRLQRSLSLCWRKTIVASFPSTMRWLRRHMTIWPDCCKKTYQTCRWMEIKALLTVYLMVRSGMLLTRGAGNSDVMFSVCRCLSFEAIMCIPF